MTTQLSLFSEAAPPARHRHTIEFDGGSTCNIPRLGFGEVYGSYRIDGGAIVRRRFGIRGSANLGEIMTVTDALRAVGALHEDLAAVEVEVTGDSQIALKWAANPKTVKKEKMMDSSTPQFRDAVGKLMELKYRFAAVRTTWVGRDYMVALFGH